MRRTNHRAAPVRAVCGFGNPRYSAARRSRNQVVLVLLLVLDCPITDYENEDDDEDERFARPATIWTDTDRLGSLRYAGRAKPIRVHSCLFVVFPMNISEPFIRPPLGTSLL